MSIFKRKDNREETLNRIKKEEMDFSSVFTAINKRSEIEQLFKSLSRRCHPDVYVGHPEKMSLAEDLFKRVMANSTNYEELLKIQSIITTELES